MTSDFPGISLSFHCSRYDCFEPVWDCTVRFRFLGFEGCGTKRRNGRKQGKNHCIIFTVRYKRYVIKEIDLCHYRFYSRADSKVSK